MATGNQATWNIQISWLESDTFRQIKEDEPRIWAGINVWVESFLITFGYMLVYIMKMEDRLIYLCKRYARQEKVILVEVYVRKMEKKLTVEDNDMGIVVILGLMEVIVTVFKMEYNTAGMQKRLTVEEGDINMSVEVVRTTIVEVVRTTITEGEYNTAEFEKKLTVEEVDINMSVEVVRTAIVEVVRTAITKREYNTTEIEKKLTVKKADIDALEDTYVGDMVIFHLVELVDIKFLEMIEIIVHKEEYNMAEVHKELTVEEGDTYMFEDIHMRYVHIIKFMEVVKKEFYNGKDGTRRREDIWSFRDIDTRLCLILEGEGVS
jgi:histone H3/H4